MRLPSVRLDRVWARVVQVALFLTFAAVSGQKFVAWATSGHLGVDLRVYRTAAEVALRGGNPWAVIVDGYYFAAPPPSLLPFIPAALMPEGIAHVVYAVGLTIAALFALRRLRLPFWWILFPPLFEGLIDLNLDVLLVPLLLGGPLAGGAAVVCKAYAVIPLLLQRRWRPIAWSVPLVLLSLPWWLTYFENREAILTTLGAQAGSLSAWGTWLMIPTAVALAALRGRGSSWIAVPALWPSTQLHYSSIALPAMKQSPVLAFLFCFAIPLLPPIAVMAEAIRVGVSQRLRERRVHAPDQVIPDRLP